jgi:hypothetical protein
MSTTIIAYLGRGVKGKETICCFFRALRKILDYSLHFPSKCCIIQIGYSGKPLYGVYAGSSKN